MFVPNRRVFIATSLAIGIAATTGVHSAQSPRLLFLLCDRRYVSDDDIEEIAAEWRDSADAHGNGVALQVLDVAVGERESLNKAITRIREDKPYAVCVIGDDEAHAIATAFPTLPMIFWTNVDPVSTGLVDAYNLRSVPRTGATSDIVTNVKPLEYLVELLPNARTIGIVAGTDWWSASRATIWSNAAFELGVSLVPVVGASYGELRPKLSNVGFGAADGWIAPISQALVTHGKDLCSQALASSRLLLAERESNALLGAAIAFEDWTPGWLRQLGEACALVVKGVAPGSIPIQRPYGWYLAVNLSTLRTLSLSVPERLVPSIAKVFNE